MSNRIESINCVDQIRLPSEAEVTITIRPERLTPGSELRGRLTGPSCLGASTVEVAYPLRRVAEQTQDTLAARAVIPEASLWEPQRPFLYRVIVELWEDGQRCDRETFQWGFRTCHLGASGLRWNGFPLKLRAAERLPHSREEAVRGRQSGFNLLIAPVAEPEHWAVATEIGFLVVGRVPLTEPALEQASAVSQEVSCLGWLVEQRESATTHLEELRRRLRQLGRPILEGREWEAE